MKEIFEVDLIGNAGSTIKNISSFSKTTQEHPNMDPPLSIDTYEIVLEYHNGSREILNFQHGFETITEHCCFGEDSTYKRRIEI